MEKVVAEGAGGGDENDVNMFKELSIDEIDDEEPTDEKFVKMAAQEVQEAGPPPYNANAGGSLLAYRRSNYATTVPHHPLASGCDDNWTWNLKDASHEVRLKGPKRRIAHFHPNWSNGTAGVRGTKILNQGRYYWELNVSQRIFGTSMMFGIGTENARLHVDAFVNMLGENNQSWGLSHKGFLWHDGQYRQYTKSFKENISTTIGILFDGIAGTLTYYKDGVNLGVAFTGLSSITDPLYPIICSTAAKTEMALGVTKREFISIQDRCRAVILRHLNHEDQIEHLELPRTLKRFISEGLSDESQEDIDLTQNNRS